MSEFSFSPSLSHRYLLDRTHPRHRFTNQPIAHWQQELRRELKALLGWDQLPDSPAEIQTQTLWEHSFSWGHVEKFVFQAEPFVDVPAYFCKPLTGKSPFPVMICLQGHSSGMHNSIGVNIDDERTPLSVGGGRAFAIDCIQHGFSVLCIEQRSLGTRQETHQSHINRYNPCFDAAMHALMLGRTLLGERVFDVQCGLTYLKSRTDVNTLQIGIMGNSGGGSVASYAAALLPELAFTMPSCSFCTFKDSLMAIYHCADNFVPGLYQLAEMADIFGLIAPRPIVIVSGQKDELFPLNGVQSAWEQLQPIYQAAQAEHLLRWVVGPEGHQFYPDLAWNAAIPVLQQLHWPVW
jgi:dienelactone hydrolase